MAIQTLSRARDAARAVREFNANHPIGQRVRFWNGVREGSGLVGNTYQPAFALGGHTACVWIRPGARGPIALTHVEPIVDPIVDGAPAA